MFNYGLVVYVQIVTNVHHSVRLRFYCDNLSTYTCYLFQIGNRYYLQTEGISQGAVTSNLLCNYYYGHMEKYCLVPNICRNLGCSCHSNGDIIGTENDLENETSKEAKLGTKTGERNLLNESDGGSISEVKESELLMRMVDDFLFVTPYKEHARNFLTELVSGK